MKEYIEREAVLRLETIMPDEDGFDRSVVLSSDIRRLPAADVVSRAAFDQVMWERDVAIQQLREDYGVGLGEKKSADVVERKRGEWVDVVFDPVWKKMKATCTSCSHRGEIRVKSNYCGFVVPDSDFCPNCGDDMRSHQNILCDQAEAELTL